MNDDQPGGGTGPVSMEEHVLLMYRMDRAENDLTEIRANLSRVVWLLIGSVFTISGAILIAALLNQGAFG